MLSENKKLSLFTVRRAINKTLSVIQNGQYQKGVCRWPSVCDNLIRLPSNVDWLNIYILMLVLGIWSITPL